MHGQGMLSARKACQHANALARARNRGGENRRGGMIGRSRVMSLGYARG